MVKAMNVLYLIMRNYNYYFKKNVIIMEYYIVNAP